MKSEIAAPYNIKFLYITSVSLFQVHPVFLCKCPFYLSFYSIPYTKEETSSQEI